MTKKSCLFNDSQKHYEQFIKIHVYFLGTAVFCGQLHAVGGYDGTNLLDTMEKLNNVLGEWEVVSKFELSRCDMGVSVVQET